MLALVGLAVALAVLDRRSSRAVRLFAAWIALGVALHLLVGSFGHFYRYEIYAFSAALIGALLLYGARLASLGAKQPGLTVATVVILLPLLSTPYWHALRSIPGASSNIYRQQYQMHRFVTEFWRAPVAVNDLGWVSYRNDEYVLDLWGLASEDALRRRLRGDDPNWLDDTTREHDVKLAMIYDDWFPVRPAGWIAIAELTLEETLISASRPTVMFYALDPEAAERAGPLLEQFRASLPPGVRLTLR
jgi:hypothetical protein